MLKEYLLKTLKNIPIKSSEEDFVEYVDVIQNIFNKFDDDEKKKIISHFSVANKNFYNFFIKHENNSVYLDRDKEIERIQKSFKENKTKELLNYDFDSFSNEEKCKILQDVGVLRFLDDFFWKKKNLTQIEKKFKNVFKDLKVNEDLKGFFSTFIEKELDRIYMGFTRIINNVVFSLLDDVNELKISEEMMDSIIKKSYSLENVAIFLMEPFFSKHKELLKNEEYSQKIATLSESIMSKIEEYFFIEKYEHVHNFILEDDWESRKNNYIEAINFFIVNKDYFVFNEEKYKKKITPEFLEEKRKSNLIKIWDFIFKVEGNEFSTYWKNGWSYLAKESKVFGLDVEINEKMLDKYSNKMANILLFKVALLQKNDKVLVNLFSLGKLRDVEKFSEFDADECVDGFVRFFNVVKDFDTFDLPKDTILYMNNIIDDVLLKLPKNKIEDIFLRLDNDTAKLIRDMVMNEHFIFGRGREEVFFRVKKDFELMTQDVMAIIDVSSVLDSKSKHRKIKV